MSTSSASRPEQSSLRVNDIKKPPSPPRTSPDELTLEEELSLDARKSAKLEHLRTLARLEQHLEIIREERDQALKRVEKLERIKERHIVLRERHRGRTWLGSLAVFFVVVGGVCVNLDQIKASARFVAASWTILAIGVLLQLLSVGVFKRPKKDVFEQ